MNAPNEVLLTAQLWDQEERSDFRVIAIECAQSAEGDVDVMLRGLSGESDAPSICFSPENARLFIEQMKDALTGDVLEPAGSR